MYWDPLESYSRSTCRAIVVSLLIGAVGTSSSMMGKSGGGVDAFNAKSSSDFACPALVEC
jgi:hypothetical protein